LREQKIITRGSFEKRIFAITCDAKEGGEADQYLSKNKARYQSPENN